MTAPGEPGQWQYQQQGTGAEPAQGGTPSPPYPPFGQQPPYPPMGQPGPGYPPPQLPPRRRRGLVIALVIALVAVAGGIGTWFALSQNDSGAPTPTAAALRLADALSSGDVVGLLSTLAPAEADLLTGPAQQAVTELKRLKVLDPGADPKAVSGLQIRTANLTFDEAGAERVNDHVTITKLTGGTLTVTGDPAKLPVAKEFLDTVEPGVTRGAGAGATRTIDIGRQLRRSGPVRIATVQVGGSWYPSLLYTIADYALRDAGERWPSTSVPANGAASPSDAVRALLQAAFDSDARRMIELMPPDEMGALHDAGPAIVAALARDTGRNNGPSGATVLDLQAQTRSVAGATLVTLTALHVRGPEGEDLMVLRTGSCYQMTMDGEHQSLCPDDFANRMRNEEHLPSALRTVLQHVSVGLFGPGISVVTTRVNGKYYVSPIRSLTELGLDVLRSLQPDDIAALLRFAR